MESNTKIVSWNVNSIKARLDHVKRYLEEEKPDVLMIQELKGLEFPSSALEENEHYTHAVCQKAYNGVAIIARTPITVIHDHLPGDDSDEQARYIEADINGIRLINIYLPNGNPVTEPKYEYKLAWMERLYKRLKELTSSETPFIIGGDFNVIPENKDCYSPKDWEGDAAFRPETHKIYRKILNLGLTDAFRVFDTRAKQYSFWDYQAGAWQRGNGIRIDHFLLSPLYADLLQGCTINKTPRGWEKPSDHTPIEIIIGK
ncbi:MAG: exodeoxyribonuclease III [Alphaproteobacteria bacterium]